MLDGNGGHILCTWISKFVTEHLQSNNFLCWKLSSSHSTLLVLATPGVITKEELKTFLSDNDEWTEAQVDEHVKQVDFWACFLYISSFIQVYTYCSGMNADWRWDGSSWWQYYFCTVGGVVWEKSLIIFQQRFRLWTGFLLRLLCCTFWLKESSSSCQKNEMISVLFKRVCAVEKCSLASEIIEIVAALFSD